MAPMSVTKTGGRVLTLLTLIGLFESGSARTLCKRTIPGCVGNDCTEVIDCFRGICDEEGNCECLPCYSGDTCSTYDDKYGPRFAIREDTVIINAQHVGVVYKAVAEDEDLGLTCPLGPGLNTRCPCATIHYTILDEKKEVHDLFGIHDSSGLISLNPGVKLEPGRQYQVEILASSTNDSRSEPNHPMFDSQVLTVVVRRDDSLQDLLLHQEPLSDTLVAVDDIDDDDDDSFNEEDYYDRRRQEVEEEEEEEEEHGREFEDGVDSTHLPQAPLTADLVEPETLVRKKRNAAGADGDISEAKLVLTKTNGPSGTLEPGNTVFYTLTIALPILSTAVDMVVEIFVMDVVSGITQFALCDVETVAIGNAITDDTGAALNPSDFPPEYKLNEEFGSLYDRAIIDFGKIKNADTYDSSQPADAPSIISITFSATLLKNANYLNDTVIVTAGAEYDSEKWVWVSQDTHNFGPGPTSFPNAASMINSPTNIPQYGAGSFELEVYQTDAFNEFLFEVHTPEGIHDKFSVSHIYINFMGSHYDCMLKKTITTSYDESASGRTYHRASMKGQILMKEVSYPLVDAYLTDQAFKIEMGFNILIQDAEAGETVKVGVSAVFGTTTVWLNEVTVTVNPAIDPLTGGPPVWEAAAPLTPTAVADGGTVTWGKTAVLSSEGNYQVDCTVTPAAGHKACGVTYGTAGPNIAALPPITLTNTSGSLQFEVFIYSTAHFSDASASKLVFEVSVQFNGAPADTAITCVGSGTNADTLSATSGTAGVTDMTGSITISAPDTATDTKWYDGSQAGLHITLTFPAGGVPYTSLVMETAGDLDTTDWGARACGARIISAGVGVPCIAGKIPLLNQGVEIAKAKDTSVFDDGIRMDLGASCGTSRTDEVPPSAYEVDMAVFYEMPKEQATTVGGTFDLSVGYSLGDDLIWTGWGSLEYDSGAPPYNPSNAPIFVLYSDPIVGPIAAGIPQIIKYLIKLPPGSVAHYILTAKVDGNAEQISICKILILDVGSNFPCVDKEPYFKEDEPYQHQTIIHDSTNWGLEAVLDLGVQRNLGTGSANTFEMGDANSFVVGVVMKGVTAGDGKLTATLSASGTDLTPVETDFTVESLTPTGDDDIVVSAEAVDGAGADVSEGAMKLIDFKLKVAPGYAKEVIATITNTALTDITVCFAAVYWAGENLPCLIPSLTKSNKTESSDTQEVMEVQLGPVCHYPFTTNETEDEAVIRVGAMFMPGSGTSATVELVLNEGGSETSTTPFALSKIAGDCDPGSLNVTGMELKALNNGTETVTVGLRTWIGVSFTLPKEVTAKLEFAVMTPTDAGRAYVTVHNFRFSRETAGKNLGCLLEDCSLYEPTIIQNSSITPPMIHETQTDTLSVNLNCITNTGLTHAQHVEKPVDDELWFEADLWVADHPNTTDGTVINVYFAVKAADKIFVVNLPLTLSKTITPAFQITNQIFLTDNTTTLFAQAEKVGVTIRTFHIVNESTQEANDAKVRLLMPKYLSYEADDTCTPNITGNVTFKGYLDFDFSNLFFTDILEMNCSLTVDVNKTLPKGLGIVNATTLMRLVCSSNTDSTLKYCGNTSYIVYQLDGSDCADSLDLDNFDDCQLTASSAIDEASGPHKVKSAADSAWSPPVRAGSEWEHYLTLDFVRKNTRVTKILFSEVAGMLSVKQFKLQYSHNGQIFTDACANVIEVSGSGEVSLPSECRFEARFGRMIIVSVSNGLGAAVETPGNTPIGVKFTDWKGCYQDDVVETCDSTLTTLYSDDYKQWRHVAYDVTNNIVYFCDVPLKKSMKDKNAGMVCYCATDGTTWIALPRYVGYLVGHDPATGAMYAMDRKGCSMVKSIDGANWTPVADADHAAITAAVTPPSSIPGKSSLPVVAVGPWTADADGMALGGAYKVKWADCCS